jgi:hypothetical protein
MTHQIIDTGFMQETESTATSWLRCWQIIGVNPVDAAPALHFYMEQATRLPCGAVIQQQNGVLTSVLTEENAGTSFEIAGETYTYAQVHKMLYGLMLHLHAQQGVSENVPASD